MTAALVGRDRELDQVWSVVQGDGSIVVTGGAGVGKSALLREVAGRAPQAGWEVHQVVGSLAARGMHLAAVVRLVPSGGPQRPHELIAATVDELRRRAERRPQLLLVDDAHLLDDGSAVLVQELVLDGTVPVAAAVRHGDECPDPVVRLWKDEHARHLEIRPLPRETAAELLAELLGGPVGPGLEAEFWRLTRGNPLFLREFVLAVREDALRSDNGVWVAVDRLPGSRRLADVVDMRLRGLHGEDREAVELLSVAEPLPLPVARELLGEQRLQWLEAQELATVDGATGQLRAFHPMHGEVLRSVMPATRRSALAIRVADALLAVNPSEPELLVRTTTTLVAAGREPPSDLLLRAAEAALAMGDPELSAQLAEPAREDEPLRAGIVRGRALRLLERGEAAELALDTAAEHAEEEAEVGEVALERARNLFWVVGDIDRGRMVVADALAEINDQIWRGSLEGELRLQAMRFGDELLAEPPTEDERREAASPRATLQRILVDGIRKGLELDADGLDDALERGFALAEHLREEEPLAMDQCHFTWMQRMMYEDIGRAVANLAHRPEHDTPLGGVWSMDTAIFRLLLGRPRQAVPAATEACVLMERTDPFGNLPMARAIRALALVLAGDVGRAAIDEDFLSVGEARQEPRTRVWADRALAWLSVARDDLDAAVATIHDGAVHAVASGNTAWGCDLLHDAVRIGHAEPVADLLQQHAAGTGFRIAELYAAHAIALVDGDLDALTGVGRGLAATGHLLHAAEPFAQAAALHEQAGDGPAASRAALQAQLLAEGTNGPATPAMAVIDGLGASPRELEVIGHCLLGRSNKEIADALVLSARTVENHLSRVYARLDVPGRVGLATLAHATGAPPISPPHPVDESSTTQSGEPGLSAHR